MCDRCIFSSDSGFFRHNMDRSRWLCLLVVALGLDYINCLWVPKVDVLLEAYEPAGLQVFVQGMGEAYWLPATKGIQMFEFHAKINQEINGSEPGDIAIYIRKADADGYFRYFDPTISLKVGDKVNFWFFLQYNNWGYTKKFSWTVTNPTKRTTGCVTSPTRSPGIDRICSGALILEDEFTQIDTQKWRVEHYIADRPDYEFVIYSDEPVQASNSKLEIKPTVVDDDTAYAANADVRDKCTRTGNQCYLRRYLINAPTRSARLTSKIMFSYADVEVRARLPQGDWIFPEIYLEEDDPGENHTRIYIAYARGNKQLVGNAGDDLGGSLLFGGPVLFNKEPKRSKYFSSYQNEAGPLSDDFHTYRLKWTPDLMELYIDGILYGYIKNRRIKSDKFSGNTPTQFHLVIGVGVGGMNDFPDHYKSGDKEKPWINEEAAMVKNFYLHKSDWLPTWGDKSRLEVEYVKVKAI